MCRPDLLTLRHSSLLRTRMKRSSHGSVVLNVRCGETQMNCVCYLYHSWFSVRLRAFPVTHYRSFALPSFSQQWRPCTTSDLPTPSCQVAGNELPLLNEQWATFNDDMKNILVNLSCVFTVEIEGVVKVSYDVRQLLT